MAKVVIPEGMKKAAVIELNDRYGYARSASEDIQIALEAALQWLDGEIERLLDFSHDGLTVGEIEGRRDALNGVRALYVDQEPEVPPEIKDLQLIDLKQIKNQADLDYWVRQGHIEAYRRGQRSIRTTAPPEESYCDGPS